MEKNFKSLFARLRNSKHKQGTCVCSACGASIKLSDEFCPYCGTSNPYFHNQDQNPNTNAGKKKIILIAAFSVFLIFAVASFTWFNQQAEKMNEDFNNKVNETNQNFTETVNEMQDEFNQKSEEFYETYENFANETEEKKTADVNCENLPIELKDNSLNSVFMGSVTIESVEAYWDDMSQNRINITVSGTVNAVVTTGMCAFNYQILDEEGFVTDSGFVMLSNMSEGSKFKKEIWFNNAEEGKTYTVQFSNYQ